MTRPERCVSLLWHLLAQPGPKTPAQLAAIHYFTTSAAAKPGTAARRNAPGVPPAGSNLSRTETR